MHSPFLPLLLLSCVSVSTCPQGGKRDICRQPSCIWISGLREKGQFKVSGDLDALDDGKAFCHDGVQLLSLKGLANLWTDLRVLVSMSPKDGLIIGKGNSSEHALSGDETLTSQRNGSHLLHLSPYGVDCVGLVPEGGSQVRYQLAVKREVAHRHLVLLAMGLGLLFAAPRLSRSVSLFYGAGITLGVVASVLILLYVFSKFVPRKTSIVGLGILTGGYTLFASFFYWFWNHAMEVAVSNWQYVMAYVVAAALLSFAILYRMSPPTNVRSLNLIQWGVQLVGVACIYLGCLLNEVGVAAVIIALLLYNLSHWFSVALYPFRLLLWLLCCLLSPLSCLLTPFSCILTPLSRCLSLFNPWRWFAPKHRFLTQQEYEEQGRVETKKELEKLREYCRRRGNDEIWDKISNLHDSKRFTSFLAGKAHISAQEQVDYEWSEVGLDSMSESGSETEEYNEDASRVASHSPHSLHTSNSSRSSSLSYSINSSSDSPTFTHARRHTSHSHLTSTPRTRPPSHH